MLFRADGEDENQSNGAPTQTQISRYRNYSRVSPKPALRTFTDQGSGPARYRQECSIHNSWQRFGPSIRQRDGRSMQLQPAVTPNRHNLHVAGELHSSTCVAAKAFMGGISMRRYLVAGRLLT